MTNRITKLGLAAVVLLLAVAALPAATQAQTGKHGAHNAVKGVVLSVSGSSLQVQTSSGTATVSFNGTTRVAKLVTGSTSDLSANQRVELKLSPGTTTATAVTIDAAFPRMGGPEGTGHWAHKPGTGTTKPAHTWTGVRQHAGGTVVSFSNGTLTLKGRNGQTLTYKLAPNATIQIFEAGTTADLAKGQTIEAAGPTGSPARFIVILKG